MTQALAPDDAGRRTIRGAVLETQGAAQPYAESKPLAVSELSVEAPGEDEIFVRMTAAGVCHSDLSVVNNDRPRELPLLLGHEATGVVEELGSGVDDLEVGDHVVMTFQPRCGECKGCRGGGRFPCEKGGVSNANGTLLRGTRHLKRGDETVDHFIGVSAFATGAVVDRHSVVKIGKDVPPAIACVFGCAFLTGGGALLNVLKPGPEDSVAVVGLGGVGMAAVLVAKALGIKELIGVDLSEEKRKQALDFGCTKVYSPEEAVEEGVRADAVLEAVGHPSALKTAWDITAPGQTTCTIGLPHPDATLEIKPFQLTAQARRLVGSYLGSAIPENDIPRYEQLWREGRLDAEKLISSSITLDEINEAMDTLSQAKALRQIIHFD